MAIRFSAILALLFVAGAGVGASSASADRGGHGGGHGHGHGDRVEVERLRFPVRFAPDGSRQTIVAYSYNDEHDSRPRPTVVMIHGATYDHRYWDPGLIDGEDYSFARYLARAGYQVIAIDQLGAGESTDPNGDLVTIAALADSVHQVIGQIRNDRHLTRPCDQIALVGHSMGSMTASYLEGTYHDVDALVATGYSNVPVPLPINPADLAPFMTGPYFSLPSFVRNPLFFYTPFVDPAVPDYDNANLANALPRGQMIDAFAHTGDPTAFRSQLVTVPVMVQMGEFDVLYPGAIAASQEAPYWPASDDVTVDLIEDSGHDINFHIQREEAWENVEEWLDGTLSDGHSCGCGRGHGR